MEVELPHRYSRRVLFNNLDPDIDVSSKFYLYSTTQPHPQELEVSKMFGNYTLAPRKRLKLPEAPSKLILKNKLSPVQLHQNLQHAMLLGVSYHGDLNALALHPPDSVPRLELARVIGGTGPAVQSDSDSESDLEDEKPVPLARRKLYSDMTAEELMALDPQFAKPKTSNLDNFKFDSKQTFYLPSARRSSTTATTLPKQVIYPSSNENNYKLISLTMKHQDYDHDLLATRTLLTVLSGRKHTWNTLDWLLLDGDVDAPVFLQDGDYLVVAALVPLKYFGGPKKKTLEERLFHKCENLLNYVMQHLPDPLLRLKITVEFVIDVPPADPMTLGSKKAPSTGTKFMLSHLFKQYLPTLVVLGNKLTNLNFKYPTRRSRGLTSVLVPAGTVALAKLPLQTGLVSCAVETEADQYLIKLSSHVIRYSAVPVVVVGNSTKFHRKTESKPAALVTFSDSVARNRSILETPAAAAAGRKNSATSVGSIESLGAQQDSSSQSSLDFNLDEKMEELAESLAESRFFDMAACISLSSLSQLKQYLNVINDDSIHQLSQSLLNSKVHQVYQSKSQARLGSMVARTQSNGTSGTVYKVKSLVSYSEEEEKRNERRINDKKLKKTLSRNSATSTGQASDDKKLKTKRSFLQKLGLKK